MDSKATCPGLGLLSGRTAMLVLDVKRPEGTCRGEGDQSGLCRGPMPWVQLQWGSKYNVPSHMHDSYQGQSLGAWLTVLD